MVVLPVQPGIVAAGYFILFDLIILAMVDAVLARCACWVYYRHINAGAPMSATSADVPGVTTFLLGRFISIVNILTLLVKLVFLGLILAIDLGIDSVTVPQEIPYNRSGTFVHNASEVHWVDGKHRIVARQWERVRQCRVTNHTSGQITFFHLAFDLDDDRIVVDEVSPDHDQLINVKSDSIVCQSDAKVRDSVPMHHVIGCSTLNNMSSNRSCSSEHVLERNGSLDFSYKPNDIGIVSIEEGTGFMTFAMTRVDSENVTAIWPEYRNGNMTCMSTKAGPPGRILRTFVACLVFASDDRGGTLIERWEHNVEKGIFTRYYAGPVFKGHMLIGNSQRALLLQSPVYRGNWESLSSVIIADGCIYRRQEFKGTMIGKASTKTKVPNVTLGIAIGMIVATVLARVAVFLTIGRDERPQLNSIDGISSIGREEHYPTGRSYVSGSGMILGLSPAQGNVLRFGPLRSTREGVSQQEYERQVENTDI